MNDKFDPVNNNEFFVLLNLIFIFLIIFLWLISVPAAAVIQIEMRNRYLFGIKSDKMVHFELEYLFNNYE